MALPSLPETSSWSPEEAETGSLWTKSEQQMSSEEHPDEAPFEHPLPVQNETEALKEPEGSWPSHPSQDDFTVPTTLSEDPADKWSTKPPEATTTVTALPAKEDRSPTDMFLSDRDKETYKEIMSSLDKCGQSDKFTEFPHWNRLVASIWGGLVLRTPDGRQRPLSAEEALIRFSAELPEFGLEVSDREKIKTLGKHFAETFPVPSIERDRTLAWMQGQLSAVVGRFGKTWGEKYDRFTGKKPYDFRGFEPTYPEDWKVVVEPSLPSVMEEAEKDSSDGADITVCQDTEQCVQTAPSTDVPGPPTNILPKQSRVTRGLTANSPSLVRSESDCNAHPPRRSMTSFVTDSKAQNSTMTSESGAETDRRPAKRLKSSLATDDKLQDHTRIPETTSQGLDSTPSVPKTTSTLETTSAPRRRKMTAISGSSTAVPSKRPPEASKQTPASTIPRQPARPTSPRGETKPSRVSPQSKRLTFEPKDDSPASAWLHSFHTKFDKANGMERQLPKTTWLGDRRTFKARKGDYECTGSCVSNGRLFQVTCDVRRGKESLWRTRQAWNMVGEGGYQSRIDWTGKKTSDAAEPSRSELYKQFSQVVQDTDLADLLWPAPFKIEGASIWDDGNVSHGELPWTLLPPPEQAVNTLVS